jgi:hypothetical protein
MIHRMAPALVVCLGLALPAGLLAPACSAETDPPASAPAATGSQTRPARAGKLQTRPSAAPAATTPLSFSDEDLKRFGGTSGSTATRPAGSPAPSADPLKSWRDQEERTRWRREKAAELDKQVKDLEERLRFLERKRLSIANPLVGRPPEPGAAESKEEETGLTGPELLARTDAEIKQVTQDLEKARRAVTDLLTAYPE